MWGFESPRPHVTDIPIPNDPFSDGTDEPADHLNSELLKILVDSAPTGAAHLDSHGRAVRVNDRWEVTTGQPMSHSLGEGWTTDIDPDGRTEFLAALTRSLDDSKGL